jgi:uncharacterized protein YpiB (UPF0302 family)
MDRECLARKQGEVDAARVVLDEAIRAKTKKELLKRLDHIQELARHRDFEEIDRLLQSGYV